jgi:endonuclease/exonuclease/phosphatase family metal-dependent hydrolase
LARVIRSARPDVVCVQEAPRFLRWRSSCAALARMAGLVVVGGGRPAGANLIMSTLGVDVLSVHDVAFSTDPLLHRRGTAIAVLRLRGSAFAVAGTHLDLKPQPRLRHVGELDAAIAAHVPAGIATVVCADVNDQPGSSAWDALTRDRVDAWTAAADADGFTSTAKRPHQRIDAVFVPAPLRTVAASVLDGADVERASDHRPILVEVDLG